MTVDEKRESNRLAMRRYRLRNPGKSRDHYLRNREKYKLHDAEYYAANRQRISERRKKRRKDNVELFRARRRADYLKIGRARLNEIRRLRMETDANFRLRANLSSRVRMAIFRRGGTKSRKTAELIGCSVEFLRQHLEARFSAGMSWENIGKWEVDHIIPCAEFDLREEAQQFQCFHYSNLQPLWATDNRSKGAKVLQVVQ